ncbi:putative Fungal-specific transcription factor domain-containing protein [Seiridium unicorne]|uniref:Fungal-specific transcription factor domain-containing protein n=1 Tax=Seiridium unicorne TaxID=138068 RepID=A0ABR2VFG0_9PEZI
MLQVRPPQCWSCRRRGDGLVCDGSYPACLTCKRYGVECAGYDDVEVVPGGSRNPGHDADTPDSSKSLEDLGSDSELAEFTSDQILEPTAKRSPIFNQPSEALYRKAQMIFEGLDYFNQMICPDLVSLENHFNPYKVNLVNLQSPDRLPEIYVKVLVSVASFHRLMSHGPEPTSSSALVQRDESVFQLRVEALQGLNQQLSLPDQQISDSTLLCVLSLMVASIQASAYTEWRAHLEGARRIIQLRGGLKKVITGNPYFKPVLTFFMLIDVIGSTTTSSTHSDMPVACQMAMHYWEIEPGVLQYVATTCIPVPDVLFRVISLVNYLRSIENRSELAGRRKAGTKMAIEKVLSFSPTEYSSKMQYFNGWSTSGKEVGFSDGHTSPQTLSTSSSSSEGQSSTASSPSTDQLQKSVGEMWLGIGVMYRASTLLYTLRTLVIDSEEDPSQFLPEKFNISVDALRQETFEILYGALTPVFSDPVTMHQIGKLIMWPLFILGMETHHMNTHLRDFVTNGFSALSQALGTLGPIGVVNELEVKWGIDAERAHNSRVKWDDYFQGREDFIVF